MRMLVTAAALAALIATPALAQTTRHKTQKTQHQPTYSQNRSTSQNQRHSDNPSNDVYDMSGAYLGSDPDASVRTMILHDQGTGND